jgi:hypothetical protein
MDLAHHCSGQQLSHGSDYGSIRSVESPGNLASILFGRTTLLDSLARFLGITLQAIDCLRPLLARIPGCIARFLGFRVDYAGGGLARFPGLCPDESGDSRTSGHGSDVSAASDRLSGRGWQRGVERPSGPAARLLEVLDPERDERPVVPLRRGMTPAACQWRGKGRGGPSWPAKPGSDAAHPANKAPPITPR